MIVGINEEGEDGSNPEPLDEIDKIIIGESLIEKKSSTPEPRFGMFCS